MIRPKQFWLFPAAIILLWVFWVLGVLLHGNGGNIAYELGFEKYDYKAAGEFGDAFGALSSFMASLAAAGAWIAVNQTRKQAFESTFYSLLAHHNQIISTTDIQAKRRVKEPNKKSKLVNTDKHVGRDAFNRLLRNLRLTVAGMRRSTEEERVLEGYKRFHNKYTNDLAHYFRTLYHIIKFIDDSSISNKSLYAKIVRAQLSDSEQTLLMYNCSVGKGRQKFKALVEKYSLLHNLSFHETEDHWENQVLRPSFKRTAFRDEDSEKWPTVKDLLSDKKLSTIN